MGVSKCSGAHGVLNSQGGVAVVWLALSMRVGNVSTYLSVTLDLKKDGMFRSP